MHRGTRIGVRRREASFQSVFLQVIRVLDGGRQTALQKCVHVSVGFLVRLSNQSGYPAVQLISVDRGIPVLVVQQKPDLKTRI